MCIRDSLFPGGATLDRLPITQFVGTALVIDCTDLREGGRIAMDRVERRRADADMAEFLLFRTGWDRYWGDPRYFGDYPCIGDLSLIHIGRIAVPARRSHAK